MNKAIYIYAAAALTLASCSSDEVIRQAERADTISFRTHVAVSTRGALLDQAGLQTNGKLYVTTFKTTAAGGEQLYAETEYGYNSSESVWVSDPPQKWEGNTELDFFLAHPALSTWQTGFAGLTKESKMVTLTVDQEIADQKDYVAAKVRATKNGTASVPVDLQHMLSAIEVWAKSDNPTLVYQMQGVRLCGVNKRIDIDLDKAVGADGFITHHEDWRDYETETTHGGSYLLINGDQAKVGLLMNTSTPTDDYAILPPQQAGQNRKWDGVATAAPGEYVGSYIAVKLSVRSKDGAQIYPAGGGYGWVAVPVEFEWKSGMKYRYTLNFSKGAGCVDPTDPGTDGYVAGTDPDKGKPIFGGPVTFEVEVTPWDPVTFNVSVGDWTNASTAPELDLKKQK